jgi:hypothetical protein
MKLHCCYMSGKTLDTACIKPAEWEIVHGCSTDDVTHSCSEHLGEMMTDAPVHHVYRVCPPEVK